MLCGCLSSDSDGSVVQQQDDLNETMPDSNSSSENASGNQTQLNQSQQNQNSSSVDDQETIEYEDPHAALDQFLVERNANGYDGDILDRTDQSRITVEVGSDDDFHGFSPTAVEVTEGTTVVWEWSEGHVGHDITALPSSSIDVDVQESVVIERGFVVEYTFSESGLYLYDCSPHNVFRAVGGVIVS